MLECAKENEQSTIERLRKELEGERKANEFLEKECNRYKELAEARGENNKKFDEENQKLKQINSNYEERLKNQGIRIKTDGDQIQKLFKEIEESKIDNEKLRKANAINYDEYKESLKLLKEENEELKKEIEEGNELLETEYQNKLFIAEQEINRLSTENACLKAFKEKADKRIQHLIDAIKNIAKGL